MNTPRSNLVKFSQQDIMILAIIISILFHLLFILTPFSITTNSILLRNVGVSNGAKTTQLFLKKKSEKHGEDLNLSTLSTIGRQDSFNQRPQSSSLSALGKFSLPTVDQPGIGIQSSNLANNILIQKIKGKDIPIPQGSRFSEKSRHTLDGSMFDVGIILPEGIQEDQLNRFEEMFFSFRRRVAEQYINQILRIASEFEDNHPRTVFPWTNKTQILRAKLTYDLQGNLQRIDFLQKADTKILQGFYQEVMNNMNKIPNPPQAIINQEESFELIFGLNIID